MTTHTRASLPQAELRAFGVTVLKMTEPVSLDLYKAEASTQFDIVLEESNDPLVTGVPVAEAFKYQASLTLSPIPPHPPYATLRLPICITRLSDGSF